jgi:hypothetical protein
VHSFVFLTFIASQAKQRTFKSHTFVTLNECIIIMDCSHRIYKDIQRFRFFRETSNTHVSETALPIDFKFSGAGQVAKGLRVPQSGLDRTPCVGVLRGHSFESPYLLTPQRVPVSTRSLELPSRPEGMYLHLSQNWRSSLYRKCPFWKYIGKSVFGLDLNGSCQSARGLAAPTPKPSRRCGFSCMCRSAGKLYVRRCAVGRRRSQWQSVQYFRAQFLRTRQALALLARVFSATGCVVGKGEIACQHE